MRKPSQARLRSTFAEDRSSGFPRSGTRDQGLGRGATDKFAIRFVAVLLKRTAERFGERIIAFVNIVVVMMPASQMQMVTRP